MVGHQNRKELYYETCTIFEYTTFSLESRLVELMESLLKKKYFDNNSGSYMCLKFTIRFHMAHLYISYCSVFVVVSYVTDVWPEI